MMAEQTKLNLGCGHDILSGYVNIDCRATSPDVVIADVRKLPYGAQEVDEIRAVDVFEHIPFRESQALLKHWVALLRPGGILFIQSPDLNALANFALAAKKPEQIESAIARVFGRQDYPENTHYTAVHPVLMRRYLRAAGVAGQIRMKTGFGNNTNIRIWASK
jgi:predicted SAM-dependent methyltransferase